MIPDPDISLLQKRDDDEWDKAHPLLLRLAYNVSRKRLTKLPKEDSDEIAATAVLDGYKQVSKYESWPKLMSFVAIRAKCGSIDHIRKYGSEKRGSGKVGSLDEEGYEHIPDSNGQDLDKKYLLKEFKEVLNEAMGLNDNERNCLLLHHYHGVKYEEISDKTGIPTGSVGVYIKRAKMKIRKSNGWKKFVESM